MNRDAMTMRAKALALLAPLTLLAACGGGADGGDAAPLDRADTQGVVLEGSTIGGPFELVDSTGKTVRWSDFDGEYRMVYFGYTFCPDVCPVDVQKMAQALALVEKDAPALAAKIQPIFVTIDPERDTPPKVGEFTNAFSDDMIGLTGTPEQVKVAADAFAVSYSKGEEMPGGGYLMGHSNLVYLMGPKGEPLVALPVDLGPEAMAQDIRRWVS